MGEITAEKSEALGQAASSFVTTIGGFCGNVPVRIGGYRFPVGNGLKCFIFFPAIVSADSAKKKHLYVGRCVRMKRDVNENVTE